MPNAKSPERIALLSVLSDGQWHDRDQLIAVGTKAIEPGRAFRKGEIQRLRRRTDAPRTKGDDGTSIRSGTRARMTQLLHRLVKDGIAERDGDRYRLVAR